jgi:hypothetical protein
MGWSQFDVCRVLQNGVGGKYVTVNSDRIYVATALAGPSWGSR